MDTCQLMDAVSQDFIMKDIFIGVFPRDLVPSHRGAASLIANTDKSDESGTHWVAMYKDKTSCDYFDSYGNVPFENKFLRENFSCNKNVLQSPYSDVCGHYCLYFLYYRCRGYSLNEIVQNLKINGDDIVKDFVDQNYGICEPGIGQSCACKAKRVVPTRSRKNT